MDSVSAFSVFVQVAETRSFVAAGKLLGVSASAVGKNIARLEDRVGVRLFHRSTRSITLTSEGSIFLEHCRRILAEIESAQDEFSQTATLPRGRLRISLPAIGDPFVTNLGAFQKAYPDIELEIDLADRKVDVVEEGFDAVIRTGEMKDSRLTSKRLEDYRELLVGSPSYFDAHGTPERPADLAAHKCIQFRYPHTGKLQSWQMKSDDTAEIHIPTSTICNSLDARVSLALNGVGIAYLADFAVRGALADGQLVSVLGDYVTGGGTFRLLWPSGKHIAPKLRVFIDFMTEQSAAHTALAQTGTASASD